MIGYREPLELLEPSGSFGLPLVEASARSFGDPSTLACVRLPKKLGFGCLQPQAGVGMSCRGLTSFRGFLRGLDVARRRRASTTDVPCLFSVEAEVASVLCFSSTGIFARRGGHCLRLRVVMPGASAVSDPEGESR